MTESQFGLTEDQIAIRETARRFTAERITPYAGKWDETCHYPRDVWKAAGDLGFGGIYVSEEGGGIGLGRIEAALVMEAMAYGCPATSAYISIHNMAAWMLDRFGSDDLKARYLADLVTMDKIASYCLTEPGSGSDAAALRTSARREGDHYVLNGTKQFISGAGVNDLYFVMARTGEHKSRGISCFVVEKDTPGVSFGAPEKKLGWNASPTAQVIFENARISSTNLLGNEGEGFRFAMAGLDGGRLNIGACSLGGAQRCLDEAVGYVRDRRQFDRPLAEFQNTQFRLADMAAELEAARALLYLAADKVTHGAPDRTRFAAMAKLIATDTGSAVVDRALQLFGGYGYLRDYPIERFWRDLRVHRILEGTNEVMRLIIGRDLLSE
ncbi:acyl-CoA dehydrogenase family protein [Novosphingobium sp. 9]|uniref:acyl-CoA dehydrogenase family protein n=1 Tax=Novosphingobium sp. 9 TaxID=2025349 RepID=UPI0021B4F234|nr:acyl-CoA dehydrogenase family protein [Novosphingobium sp. 9]